AGAGAGESVVRAGCAFAVHAEPFLDRARIEGFFSGRDRERHPESQERADEMTKENEARPPRINAPDAASSTRARCGPRKRQRAGARTPRCGPQLRSTARVIRRG